MRHTTKVGLLRREANSRCRLLNHGGPHGRPRHRVRTLGAGKEGLHGGGALSRCPYGAVHTSALVAAPAHRSLWLTSPRSRTRMLVPVQLWSPNRRER